MPRGPCGSWTARCRSPPATTTTEHHVAARMRIVADLTFEVSPDDAPRGAHPAPTTGRVRADGTDVTVEFSRTPSLAGAGTRPLVRPLAQALDDQGLTVHLTGPAGPLLDMGHGVHAPWWQVPATGSRFIRVASVPLAVRS